MIWAADKGNKDIVELLLEQDDIDVNIQDTLKPKIFLIKFKYNFFHDIEKLNDLWNLIQTFKKYSFDSCCILWI